MSQGTMSRDGLFYWDGVKWQSTLSPDGAWRWSGLSWVRAGDRSTLTRTSFASPTKLGVSVSVLLSLCIAIQPVQLFVFDPYFSFWLARGDWKATYTVEIGSLLFFVLAATVFLMWFHRLYQNLVALGAEDLAVTPGWAVGWWFVPWGCLWAPISLATEIWRASDPRAPFTTSSQSRRGGVPVLISCWWMAWIFSLALVHVVALLVGPDSQEIALPAMSALATVVAALLAITLVITVCARQDARWRQLTAIPLSQRASLVNSLIEGGRDRDLR